MPRYLDYPLPIQTQDDRRGWLCIFGVALVFIFNVALIPTFGVVFEPMFEGDNKAAVVVMNLFQFLTNLTILATGFLLKNLSAKNFVLLGSSLTFIGLLLCTTVTSAIHLIFTFSLTIGVGLGLLNPAAFVAVLSCFTCQVIYAISFGFAALGLGQLVMPILVKYCLLTFGLKSTLFIMSGLSLFGFAGGLCLVPVKWKPCARRDSEYQPLIIRKSFQKSTIFKSIVHATDLDLLWNLDYLIIIFGLSIVYASSMNANIVLPIYLQRNGKLDALQVNNCTLAISIADISSRFFYPFIKRILRISPRAVFLIGVTGLGAIRLLLVSLNIENVKLTICICAALGFFRALTVVNQVFIMIDYCEHKCPTKLPGTLGMSVVIRTCMHVFLTWVFSAMKDFSVDMSISFYVQIVFFMCVILIWLIDR